MGSNLFILETELKKSLKYLKDRGKELTTGECLQEMGALLLQIKRMKKGLTTDVR